MVLSSFCPVLHLLAVDLSLLLGFVLDFVLKLHFRPFSADLNHGVDVGYLHGEGLLRLIIGDGFA